MNLSTLLSSRASAGRPVRVGLIGAGKFGSMVLSQTQKIDGLQMVAVADLAASRARESMKRVGWPEERYSARSANEAARTGTTFVTDDVAALLACEEIECVTKPPVTRSPAPGTRSAASSMASTWSWSTSRPT